MKRTFLHGLGSFLIVGMLGLLAIFSAEAILLALSLAPASVVAIAAANRAPRSRTQTQAVFGWLLGALAGGLAAGAFIVVVNLAALLRRSGFVDIWTPILALSIVLLLLALLLYLTKVRPLLVRRTARQRRRQKIRIEHDANRQQEPKRRREWWEVLEVDPKAGPDEIRHAYLHKVQMYHPDRLAGLAPELVQLSESRTRELNLAFEQAKRITMNDGG